MQLFGLENIYGKVAKFLMTFSVRYMYMLHIYMLHMFVALSTECTVEIPLKFAKLNFYKHILFIFEFIFRQGSFLSFRKYGRNMQIFLAVL